MAKSNASTGVARAILRPRGIFFLNQANHAVRSRLEAALAAVDMTGIQYTVLSVIGRHPGLSSAELSRRFFVTPQTMNELISGLERRALIERTADPVNRRILRMKTAPAGDALLATCDVLADRVEQEVFGAMSDEEYRTLRDLTRKLARSLRSADEPNGR